MPKKAKPKTKAEIAEKKAQKLTYSRDWMLEKRLKETLGEKLVEKAKAGCETALDKIEKSATDGHRQPAVIHWVALRRMGL